MGDLDALGRAARAGRVDQRGQVAGRDGLPRGVEVEAVLAGVEQLVPAEALGLVALDTHDVLDRRAGRVADGDRRLHVGGLGDEHARP